MLHTKTKGQFGLWASEKISKGFLPYMGLVAILVMRVISRLSHLTDTPYEIFELNQPIGF